MAGQLGEAAGRAGDASTTSAARRSRTPQLSDNFNRSHALLVSQALIRIKSSARGDPDSRNLVLSLTCDRAATAHR